MIPAHERRRRRRRRPLGTTLTIEAERRLKECEEAEQFLAGVRPPRRVMKTRAWLVLASEHGVMTAALGQRLRLAVPHRVEGIPAEPALAMRRLRMFQLG